MRRTPNETEDRRNRSPGRRATDQSLIWQSPAPETIDDVLEGTAGVAESPEVQRLRRLAIAVQHELDELRAYVAVIDPAVQAIRSIKPLAEVEQDHIEHAVRVTGSPTAAARFLQIAPATIYRKLGEYEAKRREQQRLRRLGIRAAARSGASSDIDTGTSTSNSDVVDDGVDLR